MFVGCPDAGDGAPYLVGRNFALAISREPETEVAGRQSVPPQPNLTYNNTRIQLPASNSSLLVTVLQLPAGRSEVFVILIFTLVTHCQGMKKEHGNRQLAPELPWVYCEIPGNILVYLTFF